MPLTTKPTSPSHIVCLFNLTCDDSGTIHLNFKDESLSSTQNAVKDVLQILDNDCITCNLRWGSAD
jgi:hypothetical protein